MNPYQILSECKSLAFFIAILLGENDFKFPFVIYFD